MARSRARNLGTSLVLIALLGGAAWALVRYTARSRRLAEMQFRFVAGVSHDVRTPLTAIRGAAFNLSDGVVTEPAAIGRYAKIILRNAEELTSMIENVLGFSASLHSSREERSETFAPGDLVEHAAGAMAHGGGTGGLQDGGDGGAGFAGAEGRSGGTGARFPEPDRECGATRRAGQMDRRPRQGGPPMEWRFECAIAGREFRNRNAITSSNRSIAVSGRARAAGARHWAWTQPGEGHSGAAPRHAHGSEFPRRVGRNSRCTCRAFQRLDDFANPAGGRRSGCAIDCCGPAARHGHEVAVSGDGEQGLRVAFEQQFDLMILM